MISYNEILEITRISFLEKPVSPKWEHIPHRTVFSICTPSNWKIM